MKGIIRIALTAGLATAAIPANAQHPDHQMVSPADLKWEKTATLPGAQVAVIEGNMTDANPFIIRIKFAPDTKIPPHWHSTTEHITVLTGTLNLGLGDTLDTNKTQPLPAGSVGIMQPKTHHYGWTGTNDETIIQLHGTGPWTVTYVNPADDPRKKVD